MDDRNDIFLKRLNTLPHASWRKADKLTFKQKLNRLFKGYLSFYYDFTVKKIRVNIRFEDGRLDICTRSTTSLIVKTFRFYYPKPPYTVEPSTVLTNKNREVPYSVTLKTK